MCLILLFYSIKDNVTRQDEHVDQGGENITDHSSQKMFVINRKNIKNINIKMISKEIEVKSV